MLGDVVDDDRSACGRILVRGLEIHVSRVPPDRRRGLSMLVRAIVALGQQGLCINPRGTKSQLARLFTEVLGWPVCPEEVGEALALACAAGWDFVELDARTWTLRLIELLDIRSPLHRRFVERCMVGFDLRGAPEVRLDEPSPAASKRPPGLDGRLVQALVVFLMLSVGAQSRPAPAHDLAPAQTERADHVEASPGVSDARFAAVLAELDQARKNLADRDAQLLAVQAERDRALADLADRDTRLIAAQAKSDKIGADHDTALAEMRTELVARDRQLAVLRDERDEARRTVVLQEQQAARFEARLLRLESSRTSFITDLMGEVNVARSSLVAQASALPRFSASESNSADKPRGARDPPDGSGAR